jgi:phosphatidylinositol-4,5-bisphosphate 3-kinase
VKFPIGEFTVEFFVKVGVTRVSQVKSLTGVLDGECRQFPFGQTLSLGASIDQIPRYARLLVRLSCGGIGEDGKAKRVKHVACLSLFDRDGRFVSGRSLLGLLAIDTTPPHAVNDPTSPIVISLRWPRSFAPICYRLGDRSQSRSSLMIMEDQEFSLSPEDRQTFLGLLAKNPIEVLTRTEKLFLSSHFRQLFEYRSLLPWYLKTIKLSSMNQVFSLPSILRCWWPHPTPTEIISILTPDLVDPGVRKFAIEHMEKWSNNDLQHYLLQILQTLQYEPEIDSPLTLFLLKRAFTEPKYIGLRVLWGLRSLASLPWMKSRIFNLSYAFLMYSEPADRVRYVASLQFTQDQIKFCREYAPMENPGPLLTQLAKIPSGLHLPIDPKIIVEGYYEDRCRFMDSAKHPLFETLRLPPSTGRSSISMLLKLDDDLTQDQLTLQLLRAMDLMWRKAGLDLRLSLYNVLPTGTCQGYIEVVPQAVTIAQTQRLCRGGALSSKSVLEWLLKTHKLTPPGTLPRDVIENYVRSLAGYCVGTYILGIGDRHCSNMMIREDGRFFHIDFGHFLGHFKTVLGIINREDCSFYYSEALEEVLVYHDILPLFLIFCRKALEVIRTSAHNLIYLLLSMIGTGIPELQSNKDVAYLVNVLMLNLSEEEAWQHFEKLMFAAKKSMRKGVSDVMHILAH